MAAPRQLMIRMPCGRPQTSTELRFYRCFPNHQHHVSIGRHQNLPTFFGMAAREYGAHGIATGHKRPFRIAIKSRTFIVCSNNSTRKTPLLWRGFCVCCWPRASIRLAHERGAGLLRIPADRVSCGMMTACDPLQTLTLHLDY